MKTALILLLTVISINSFASSASKYTHQEASNIITNYFMSENCAYNDDEECLYLDWISEEIVEWYGHWALFVYDDDGFVEGYIVDHDQSVEYVEFWAQDEPSYEELML